MNTAQSQYLYFNVTGTLTSNAILAFPSSSARIVAVNNATTGSYSLTVEPSGGSGGVLIPQGLTCLVILDPVSGTAISALSAVGNNLSIGGGNPNGYALNVTQAGSSQAYFGSTGSNDSVVVVDAKVSGRYAGIEYFDAGVSKWSSAKNTDNSWSVYDFAGGKAFLSCFSGGVLKLGPNQDTTIDQSGNVVITGTTKHQGNVGIGSTPTGYSLNVVQNGSSQAYFGSTGNLWSNVQIDTANSGQASQLSLSSQGNAKWTIANTTTNQFSLYDTVGSTAVISATGNGDMIVGPQQTVRLTKSGYQLQIVNAGTNQAYLASTGSNGCYLNIDNQAGSQNVAIQYMDASTVKWALYKGTNNNFNLYDGAGSKNFITAQTGGNLTLGPAQTTTLDQSGNMYVGAGFQFGGNRLVTGVDGANSFWIKANSNSEPYNLAFGYQTNGSGDITKTSIYANGSAFWTATSIGNQTTLGYAQNFVIDSSGHVGINGAGTGSYLFNVSGATSSLAYLQSTGANDSVLVLDAQTSGRYVGVQYFDAGGVKWLAGKNTDNSWSLYDSAGAKTFIACYSGGNIYLGAGQQLYIDQNSNLFAPGSSIASNGRLKLQNGVIIQWGTTGALPTSGSAVSVTQSFPVTFPNNIFSCVGNGDNRPTGSWGALSVVTTSLSTSSVTFLADTAGPTVSNTVHIKWIAIGN